MASAIASSFNSLSSFNPARGYPFLPLHYTSSISSISSSRLVCSAQFQAVVTVKATLQKISHTPAARSNTPVLSGQFAKFLVCNQNIYYYQVGQLCSSKLCCPSLPIRLHPSNQSSFSAARSMVDGDSSSHSTNLNLDNIMDKARRYGDMLPPPIKSFPWNRALEDFFQIVFDLALFVMKYLAVPLLLVTSVSEMSYCAGQRKLSWVPIPLVIGFTAAGVLKVTAGELYPFLKDTYVPWHLIAAGIFFTILKLPGPYYPFWGKIFIPHFANGGLMRIFWDVFSWYRSPQKNANP